MESVVSHPQSLNTLQRTRVFVVINGRPVPHLCPVRLPDIPPHPEAPEPRIVPIPKALVDPQTGAEISTTREPSDPQGRLIIKTSEVSMRWKEKRSRHCVTFFAYKYPIAFLPMEDIARTTWVDRMYGECHLDELRKYETNERRDLAESALTRAVRAWVKDQVLGYEAEFRNKERLRASQEQQEALRRQNEFLNKWIQKSLEEESSAAGSGGDKRRPPRPPQPPRPELQEAPVSVEVSSPFSRAGVGVSRNLKVIFRNAEGKRVGAAPFMWNSSDWAVATVDSDINAVVTHTPGVTSVWIETLDKKLRSNAVDIEVVNIKSISIRPSELTIQAGKVHQLEAIVHDRDNREFSDVYLTWLQDDSAVVSVTATGKVIGRRQGTTTIQVGDDNYTDDSCRCIVTVIPSTGTDGGKNFPRIILSEIEPDPLNPDGEPCRLSPQDGPVHQPTPQHVENNIWFINMTCPLAKYYFEKHGAVGVEWRAYHLERFVEALVKIKLNNLYQESEDISFDEMERQWREQASEVQTRAIEELAPFLDGEAVAGLQ